MSGTEWMSLLVQVPLVGIFVWFALEMNKRASEAQQMFMSALDKRDEEFEKRNLAVVDAIKNLNTVICDESAATKAAASAAAVSSAQAAAASTAQASILADIRQEQRAITKQRAAKA
jgi:hypothetical protein